jgi:hypothetical protein
MEMTLRFDFPADLDAVVDFYTRVLRFRLTVCAISRSAER